MKLEDERSRKIAVINQETLENLPFEKLERYLKNGYGFIELWSLKKMSNEVVSEGLEVVLDQVEEFIRNNFEVILLSCDTPEEKRFLKQAEKRKLKIEKAKI